MSICFYCYRISSPSWRAGSSFRSGVSMPTAASASSTCPSISRSGHLLINSWVCLRPSAARRSWTSPGEAGHPTQRSAYRWFVDLSQSVARNGTWGKRLCFRQNTMVYALELDRVLRAREVMALQGLPVADVPHDHLPPARALHGFVGEAMLIPSIATMLCSALCLESNSWLVVADRD